MQIIHTVDHALGPGEIQKNSGIEIQGGNLALLSKLVWRCHRTSQSTMPNKRVPLGLCGFGNIWHDSGLKDWVIDFRTTAWTPTGMWLACKANLVTPLMLGTLISPVRRGK